MFSLRSRFGFALLLALCFLGFLMLAAKLQSAISQVSSEIALNEAKTIQGVFK